MKLHVASLSTDVYISTVLSEDLMTNQAMVDLEFISECMIIGAPTSRTSLSFGYHIAIGNANNQHRTCQHPNWLLGSTTSCDKNTLHHHHWAVCSFDSFFRTGSLYASHLHSLKIQRPWPSSNISVLTLDGLDSSPTPLLLSGVEPTWLSSLSTAEAEPPAHRLSEH